MVLFALMVLGVLYVFFSCSPVSKVASLLPSLQVASLLPSQGQGG
jgi:hypothetical protein